ncbi:hypothetical protein NIIDMKKI_31580 [Mycobacterium kansasii]|uniref:ABC transmembrane type-1 domain-containing protein n=1 Tax=Mycobacterium kansasii TaxID=1768 RepID=A0A7G1IDI9_MYCKA|nr:hypothetical protein NIIDMKKI_31580 [Mycobacterium kansasii]
MYLGTLMVPLTVTVIPQFILMRVLGWVDTPWAMIVPGLFGSAFGTYLMRQFFRTLPADLEEAAILDGCSPWQIYWRILLPHARPAVMVLAVLTWVNVWNDFLWPLLMIQRNSLATLTLGLVRLRGEYVARWPVFMATSMLILLPLVLVYGWRSARLSAVSPRPDSAASRMATVSFEEATRRYPGADRPALDRLDPSSATVSSSCWSDRPDAARPRPCGWWPVWRNWIRAGSGSATGTSPMSIPRIAMSPWSSRTMLSTRI